MKISIIIPNYNGENLLRKNLPSVIAAAGYYEDKSKNKVEIILVDDYSVDNSVAEIKKINLNLKIIQNEKNLGFSSTVNRGVKESVGEIIVLLNTDVIPEREFLIPLLKHFEDDKVFAVGCMDKSVEGDKIILRGRGIGQWKRGFLIHSRGEVDKNSTLWVNGGSGAFKRSIWDKLGGFNSLYNPFYWEDIDLSYRAIKSGYKVLFEPKSVVVHEHEKGSINKKYSPFRIKIIAYRNQFIFVWENLTDLDLQFLHIIWLPYYFLRSFLSCDWAFFAGFFQAFTLLPKIIRFSSKMQKFFIEKDREVVKIFT